MKILDHPHWPRLRPYVHSSGEQSRGLNGPRHRLEIRGDVPRDLLGMEAHCATCGRPIAPVRARRGWQGAKFLSVSCLLLVDVACARSRAAREAVEEIRQDILRWQATRPNGRGEAR